MKGRVSNFKLEKDFRFAFGNGMHEMAREEQPREDLLREATALVERIEVQIEGFAETIVVGFRRDGAASFYFGQDFVFQFNTAGQLRRGFVDGRLYKAEAGRLVRLTRERNAAEVMLKRHNCNASEEKDFLAAARQKLFELQKALTGGHFHVRGQVPPDSDVASRAATWLANLPHQIVLADTPHVQAKKSPLE
jgi:hypothetical protein